MNAAGIGFSPFVAQRTARFPDRLGAYLYTAAGLVTLVDGRERAVRLRWDPSGEAPAEHGAPADDGGPTEPTGSDPIEEERALEALEVALGPYEGGGMLVAPVADPSDGWFDVLTVDAASRLEMATFAWRVRRGTHLASPRVGLRRARGLEVTVADERGPIFLQADGELLGRDPFRFSIVPGAVRFVV